MRLDADERVRTNSEQSADTFSNASNGQAFRSCSSFKARAIRACTRLSLCLHDRWTQLQSSRIQSVELHGASTASEHAKVSQPHAGRWSVLQTRSGTVSCRGDRLAAWPCEGQSKASGCSYEKVAIVAGVGSSELVVRGGRNLDPVSVLAGQIMSRARASGLRPVTPRRAAKRKSVAASALALAELSVVCCVTSSWQWLLGRSRCHATCTPFAAI